jgi:hypothetical protein
MRTLQFVDAELSLLYGSKAQKLPAAVLSSSSTNGTWAYRHLNVTTIQSSFDRRSGGGELQLVAAAAAQFSAGWVLIVSDSLAPMEYWLWNLATAVAEDVDSSHPTKAAKSLTVNHAGTIKSAGLQHQLTVVGDGSISTLPYMLYRSGTCRTKAEH